MFASNPTDIDQGPSSLETWLKRACASSSRIEWHLVHREAALIIEPRRRKVVVEKDGRRITVEGRTGRGWLAELTGDVSEAITALHAGGGEAPPPSGGQRIRDEIKRRDTTGQRASPHREHWMEWLRTDELGLLLGAWMFQADIVCIKSEFMRNPSLLFQPVNEEFDLVSDAAHPGVAFELLKRLAVDRGAPPPDEGDL